MTKLGTDVTKVTHNLYKNRSLINNMSGIAVIGGLGAVACLGIGVVGLVGFGAYFFLTYNKFVSMDNAIENSFNQIKVALKKRLDKISQLVDATGSMAKFEKDTFSQIAKFRGARMNNPKDVSKVAAGSGALVGQIMAVMENYPDLKTNESVAKLMKEISDIEDEIARLRYLYNDQVQRYNNMVERIPSNIVARIMGKNKKEYLQFGEDVEKRPDAKF